ncbi:MAG: sulfatase-like hydrolase/transferase [Acidobacteriota bacterium]|nr:sulfatase-like hydrolase/transferase [Acidobacteriota bacterium]
MVARLCQLVLLVATIVTGAALAQTDRPLNLVLIVADDLGYSELGSYGSEIETPFLDRLADDGVRFSSFYATPRCSPSRAALLTGVAPHRAGVGHLNRDWGDASYRGRIRSDLPILPEILRAGGHRTYMVGKWHLAPVPRNAADLESVRAFWPLQRGFDAFWGTLRGSGTYFAPPSLQAGNDPAPDPGDDFHYTHAIGKEASAFLSSHVRDHPTTPFFLYLAFTAPHWPLHATPGDIDRQEGHYDAGWDALRSARLARMVDSGLLAADTALAPRVRGVPQWSSVVNPKWQARRMEVYAAMVNAMDRAVGRILGRLRELGEADRTVVVFVSDNGASAEQMSGLNRLLPLFVPIPTETPEGEPVRFGDSPAIAPGGPETYAAYGPGWAQVSNTPWAGFKKSTAEGGISAPLIVRSPSTPHGMRGRIVRAPAQMVDLLPTVVDLLGIDATVAPGADAWAGISLRTAIELSQPEDSHPRTLFWEHEGNRGVRRGNWKFVAHWPRPPRLYDLSTDRTESHDVSAENPEIVSDLEAAWREWATANGVGRWPLVVPTVEPILWGLLAIVLVTVLVRVRRRNDPPPTVDEPPRSPAHGPIAPR